MAYKFYIDGWRFPVSPSALSIRTGNTNTIISLINLGEVNLLNVPGLKSISFDMLIPSIAYPFSIYEDGFKPPSYFIDRLEKLKVNKKTFQFTVIRDVPGSKVTFDTNIKVSLEELSIEESTDNGFDFKLSISLKEYRNFGTKKFNIETIRPQEAPKIEVEEERPAPKPQQRMYTVVTGDCLWAIAREFYGNGSEYPKIFEANRDKISDPNLIYPDQVLTIP